MNRLSRLDTDILARNAAEDWILGDNVESIARRYNRSKMTIYRWMKKEIWINAVKGRVRVKKKKVRRNRFQDIGKIEHTAKQWVVLDRPEPRELAKYLGMTESKVISYMESTLWERFVLFEERLNERRKARDIPDLGDKIPVHLLEQAVFLRLAGWRYKDIIPVIRRSKRTLIRWSQTEAWAEMREKILLDKLFVLAVDDGVTVREMYDRICEAHRLF